MKEIHVGYEVGSAEPVTVPLGHMAVTGQTQNSGKTTTLEALAVRSGSTVLTFITKRGESAFQHGHQIQPYFRDRADWQFVTSIIDATLQEKNKFLRPWIMKICRTTKTLADVQVKVRDALKTAKGINEGVYTQLDAYLDLIVPEIGRIDMIDGLDLSKNDVNVMDVTDFSTPMQMLFVQSAIDWVNEYQRDTIVVIPEAWEFVPEGKGSPVKASAVALVRKGASLRNWLWIDSQDMAGVDKVLLRGCSVWLIGVQREANEIKRNLSNIHAGIAKPSVGEIADLARGVFFVCHGRVLQKTYVQPAWLDSPRARHIAMGNLALPMAPAPKIHAAKKEEPTVKESEAQALREQIQAAQSRNEKLENRIAELTRQLDELREQTKNAAAARAIPIKPTEPVHAGTAPDMDAIYAEVKRRAQNDPGILKLLQQKPEIEVTVERPTVKTDGATQPGRVAAMIAEGFFEAPTPSASVNRELRRRGFDVNNGNLARDLNRLAEKGFLTIEDGGYQAVPGMKVNIVEAK